MSVQNMEGVCVVADCLSCVSPLPLRRWFHNSLSELVVHCGIHSIKLSLSIVEEELVDNLPCDLVYISSNCTCLFESCFTLK